MEDICCVYSECEEKMQRLREWEEKMQRSQERKLEESILLEVCIQVTAVLL